MDQHDEDLKRFDVSFLAQSTRQLDPICYDGQHSLNEGVHRSCNSVT